jgi:RimJ/RimL family protein N-acetyltransferase
VAFGWEGDLVRLVPLDEERHLENAIRWMNDPEVTHWLLVGDFPMTRLMEKDYFDRQMRGSETEVAFAIETLEGRHIGFSGLHNIDWRNRVAVTGSLIGEKEEWGKGYGTDAARVRARYCFDVLGLRLLLSSHLDDNHRSARMQEKAGYRECGRTPKRYWKRGAYHDEIRTYLDRETWSSLSA